MLGVEVQIKFTKFKSELYFIRSKRDTTTVPKFLEATVKVRHVNPSPTIQFTPHQSFEGQLPILHDKSGAQELHLQGWLEIRLHRHHHVGNLV